MLDRFFALNCGSDVVMVFEIDEPFERVPLCETVHQTFAVFIATSHEIARNAGVENTVTTIGHDVDETGHDDSIGRRLSAVVRRMDEDVDGRDKPGHDGGGMLNS